MAISSTDRAANAPEYPARSSKDPVMTVSRSKYRTRPAKPASLLGTADAQQQQGFVYQGGVCAHKDPQRSTWNRGGGVSGSGIKGTNSAVGGPLLRTRDVHGAQLLQYADRPKSPRKEESLVPPPLPLPPPGAERHRGNAGFPAKSLDIIRVADEPVISSQVSPNARRQSLHVFRPELVSPPDARNRQRSCSATSFLANNIGYGETGTGATIDGGTGGKPVLYPSPRERDRFSCPPDHSQSGVEVVQGSGAVGVSLERLRGRRRPAERASLSVSPNGTVFGRPCGYCCDAFLGTDYITGDTGRCVRVACMPLRDLRDNTGRRRVRHLLFEGVIPPRSIPSPP